MWDVLSALIPPAVVATVFCTFIYKLLRKEMAPRTSDGRLLSGTDDSAAAGTQAAADNRASAAPGAVSADGEATEPSTGAIPEVPERGPDAENR